MNLRVGFLAVLLPVVTGTSLGAATCESSRILDQLWDGSIAAVGQACSPNSEEVDLTHLAYHSRTLGVISGMKLDPNYLGPLPDDRLRAMLAAWKVWRSEGFEQLCTPLRTQMSAPPLGCLGQRRLLSLWLFNTRALEQRLRDLELGREVSLTQLTDFLKFFSVVTGMPLELERLLVPGVSAQIEILDFFDRSNEWMISHIETLCSD